MKIHFLKLIMIGFIFSSCSASAQQDPEQKKSAMDKAYIGTYTKKEGHVDGKADGILYLEINEDSGEIPNLRTVAPVTNPSFVKLSPDGKYLFAVSELGQGDADSGFIYSFRANEDGSLKQISKLSTESFAPAHIAVDNTGRFVFVSNYMGGVVMIYEVKNEGNLEKIQRIDL